MKTRIIGWICICFLTIGQSYAQNNLEIPALRKGKKELILKRAAYTLSFDKEMNIPQWVAWKMDKGRLMERVSRKGYRFVPDPDIDEKKAVMTQDYANSGYDRGHMFPAGDGKWSAQAMRESFYMTNICPQHPKLNGGDWHELEQACRKWAAKGEIYIVCGPILYKGNKPRFIGKEHKVRVPEAFFKVILAGVKQGKPRAVGFIFKNEAGDKPMARYVNSIDEMERITGLDFFPELPDEVENRIEREYNWMEWR